jgi:hypothetical protein
VSPPEQPELQLLVEDRRVAWLAIGGQCIIRNHARLGEAEPGVEFLDLAMRNGIESDECEPKTAATFINR